MTKGSVIGVVAAIAVVVVVGFFAVNRSKRTGVDGPLKYDFKPGEITARCDEATKSFFAALKEIKAIDSKARTFENTMFRLETAWSDFNDITQVLSFPKYVSKDAKLRDEADKCEVEAGKIGVEVLTDRDLYLAIKDAKGKNADEARLASETLKEFERFGLKLPPDKLERFKTVMKELTKETAEFDKNLNEDTTSAEFTQEELAGAPKSFVERLKKTADGKHYIVTTKPADYMIFMENVKSSEARHKMMSAYNSRAVGKNPAVLKQVLALRLEAAKLLGYKTWADYKTEDRMAKTAAAVLSFENDLKGKLAAGERREIEQYLAYKKSENPKASELDVWDALYVINGIKKQKYELDDEVIRPYFPSDKTAQAIFDTYAELLGIKLVQVKNAAVWDEAVKLYEIKDAATNEVLAYLYTDLYPRDGKFPHFAAFSIISGRLGPKGYSKPVSAIVGNFNPPGPGDKPSLMSHNDVETLFHEFGHIMHQTLTRAPYASLSGSAVKRDFVEAPSQMFEEWAWTPELLKKVSGHYKDGTKLPDDLIKRMMSVRQFENGAYMYSKQILYGLFDMTLHSATEPVNPDEIYARMHKEIIGLDMIKEGSFSAGFGHLMGYDAGYYGYLWSKVFAVDMASEFQKEGLKGMTDPKIGLRYRKTILERGNMEDPMELLKRFLGREPSKEPFLKQIGAE